MDAISAALPPGAASAGGAPSTPGEAAGVGSAGLISSDFETFLNMLTTQLKNQDPLDPLKATDFAVQLATFSGVEQQVLTNERLSALTEKFSLLGLSQLTGWVGMEVRAPVAVAYEGRAVTLQTAPDADAARAQLVARNAAGTEVSRTDIPLEGGPVTWSGIAADGSTLPQDTYSFTVVNRDAEGTAYSESVPGAYSSVIEARMEDGEAQLVLAGGTTVPVSEVSGVRPAQRGGPGT